MSEPFLGQIQMFGFNFAPRGWSTCDGQLLPISQYSAVFSLMGTTFGGDGRTTFGLPDLRGRSATHVGNGPGIDNVTWGQKGGSNAVNLTVGQLPAHSHPVAPRGSSSEGDETNPTGGYPAVPGDGADTYAEAGNVDMGSFSSGNAGSNQAVSIQNPFLGIFHCVALTGIFPSRN